MLGKHDSITQEVSKAIEGNYNNSPHMKGLINFFAEQPSRQNKDRIPNFYVIIVLPSTPQN